MRLLPPHEYQPAITSRFEVLRRRLQDLLPAASVEHIGASAIPGALSKGDLDICVLVAPSAHLATVEQLLSLGYVETPDTLRTDALCMLEWRQEDEAHAIQLVARGSCFEMFLTFRDALLADPARVDEYNRVKAAAAQLSESGYRAAKAAFIQQVLQDAREGGALPSRQSRGAP